MLSLDHLDAIRVAELEKIASLFPAGGRVLEIGAGTGKQALELQRRGFEVSAIELAGIDWVGPPLHVGTVIGIVLLPLA